MGDSPEADVEGARAAGLHAVLIDRGTPRSTRALSDLWPSSYPWLDLSDQTNWLPPVWADRLPKPPEPPKQVPIWAPFAALLAAVLLVAMFGAAVVGDRRRQRSERRRRRIRRSTSSLAPDGVQDAAFVFAAWITIRLALGSTPRGAVRAAARQAKSWPAIGWAALVFVGFWLITALLTRDPTSPTIRSS